MFTTLQTLAYGAQRVNVAELLKVRGHLAAYYGKKFVDQSETDSSGINEVVRTNANVMVPSNGEKVERLLQIAHSHGLDYTPSEPHQAVQFSNIDRSTRSISPPSLASSPSLDLDLFQDLLWPVLWDLLQCLDNNMDIQ